jgi:hypothetical protein
LGYEEGDGEMRTIKFRAWNTDYKEMWSWLDVKQSTPIKLVEEGKNLVFMQFTGLHDKNGKEIYESDIFHMGDQNITYTVVWHDTGFKGKQNGSSSFAGLEHWQERIEVISNIYEQEQTT